MNVMGNICVASGDLDIDLTLQTKAVEIKKVVTWVISSIGSHFVDGFG